MSRWPIGTIVQISHKSVKAILHCDLDLLSKVTYVPFWIFIFLVAIIQLFQICT